MDALNLKFMEMKSFCFSRKQIRKGCFLIFRILKPKIYLKIIWEIVTTFIVFSPSVNNYLRDVILSIRGNWDILSEKEQECIIAVLVHLNRHGRIEKAIGEYVN